MDDELRQAAERLGFKPTLCPSCARERNLACPNCEGDGVLWRDGATTLSRSGLLRLAARSS